MILNFSKNLDKKGKALMFIIKKYSKLLLFRTHSLQIIIIFILFIKPLNPFAVFSESTIYLHNFLVKFLFTNYFVSYIIHIRMLTKKL